MPPHPYIEDQAYGDHIYEHRVPAVADKRQRDAGYWHDAQGHPDVDKDLECEHYRHADADEGAEVVFGKRGNF